MNLTPALHLAILNLAVDDLAKGYAVDTEVKACTDLLAEIASCLNGIGIELGKLAAHMEGLR